MKIMALDASTKSSGVAIFDDIKLIHYTCIKSSSTDLIKRIQKMVDEFKKLIDEYSIEKIVIEEVRPESGPSLKTQKALMWLQAGINFMLHDNFPKVTIEYVYPSEWRKACGIRTGRGVKRESLKLADIQFIKDTYGIDMNDDEADATCIGHSYVNNLKNEMNWE